MVDTRRNLAALQALLADNQEGSISPQDVRDMLVTTLGSYGSLVKNALATTSIGTGAWVQIPFEAAGEASAAVSVDAAQNRLTAQVAGVWLAEYHVAGQLEAPLATLVQSQLYKNGATIDNQSWDQVELAVVDQYRSLRGGGLFSLSVGDYLELYAAHDDGGSQDFKLQYGWLRMRLIG